jgi:hypothetical protein
MTIMATHFAVVLGAWRLRIRIDIDEPRDAELAHERAPSLAGAPYNGADPEHGARQASTWGRG